MVNINEIIRRKQAEKEARRQADEEEKRNESIEQERRGQEGVQTCRKILEIIQADKILSDLNNGSLEGRGQLFRKSGVCQFEKYHGASCSSTDPVGTEAYWYDVRIPLSYIALSWQSGGRQICLGVLTHCDDRIGNLEDNPDVRILFLSDESAKSFDTFRLASEALGDEYYEKREGISHVPKDIRVWELPKIAVTVREAQQYAQLLGDQTAESVAEEFLRYRQH